MSNTFSTQPGSKIKKTFFSKSMIVNHTQSTTNGFFSTNTRYFIVYSMMLFMFKRIITQFKILNSIIKSILIYVVDDFSRFKIATKMFLHYQSMLINITISFLKRMVMGSDNPIAFHNSYATLPPKTFFSRHNFFLKSVTTFWG